MSVESWIAPAISAAALMLNVGTLLVGYGVLRATVTALAARVTTLETEMNSLGEVKVKVAEIATRQETWIEQLKELNASVRWMRQPSEYEPSIPGGGENRPARRR